MWLWMALPLSIFWGARAAYLFTPSFPSEENRKGSLWNKHEWVWALTGACYQFIFNFAGSFAGWVCLGIFAQVFKDTTTLQKLILLLGAFIGITGHLPDFLFNLKNAIAQLAIDLYKRYVSPK